MQEEIRTKPLKFLYSSAREQQIAANGTHEAVDEGRLVSPSHEYVHSLFSFSGATVPSRFAEITTDTDMIESFELLP
jgi:hypothetical protein